MINKVEFEGNVEIVFDDGIFHLKNMEDFAWIKVRPEEGCYIPKDGEHIKIEGKITGEVYNFGYRVSAFKVEKC
jgi:hypothetical protein